MYKCILSSTIQRRCACVRVRFTCTIYAITIYDLLNAQYPLNVNRDRSRSIEISDIILTLTLYVPLRRLRDSRIRELYVTSEQFFVK